MHKQIFQPTYQLIDGVFEGIKCKRSSNCDQRPVAIEINMIVIHAISLPKACYGNGHVEALFLNTLDSTIHSDFKNLSNLRVSSHLFIDRQGEVCQFVPFTLRAWHAGESEFQGRLACNDFSIGIELEGCDDDEFEENQYQKLATLCADLMHYYPSITPERIVRHSDIAPGRKTDPGSNFNCLYFKKLLRKI